MKRSEIESAWDVVAQEKYEKEFDSHVAHLCGGGHNLLGPELEVLRDRVERARVVHVQCSHGLDGLGLLNLGAASVVGIDLSGRMIEQARRKAAAMGAGGRAEFVHADASDPPKHLCATADLVYTGRGALPWIEDLEAWARAIAALLKPGGHLFVFEGHPLAYLWEREEKEPRLRDGVSYFSTEAAEYPGFPAALVERVTGPSRPRMPERLWRPGEVIAALHAAGLQLVLFDEYPLLFWDQFPSWTQETVERLPNSYAILAQRV